MPTAALFGSTGAVGSQILTTLITTDTFSSVTTISRNLPPTQSPKLQTHQESNTSAWPTLLTSLTPSPTTVFNAVGTTRAAAGGIQAQWKIDHDLCISTAEAAKSAGAKTFVFISSAGTRGLLAGYVPYSKMKVGVEEAIRGLGFEHAVVLRPGMILGREKPKVAWAESLFAGLRRLGQGVQDRFGQDQTIIGRAAVAAARMVEEGRAPSKFWVLEQADIVRLGRDEWKG